MDDIVILGMALFTWSCLCLVPASIAENRRREKKPVYWLLLFLAIVIELVLVFISLLLTLTVGLDRIAIVMSPVIGAVAGGLSYWHLSNRRDKFVANQRR